MDLALRQVDLTRLERALATILSPLAHEHCDDWRLEVESSVAELLDGDHVVFGIPRAGVPMHVHATNVAAQPQRAIQTLFGQLPDLPADPWLQEAERERLRSRAEVWSQSSGRSGARPPGGRMHCDDRHSSARYSTPGRIYDSENIDWSVGGGHVALCVSYATRRRQSRSRRSSAERNRRRAAAATAACAQSRSDHAAGAGHVAVSAPSLARLGLTRREARGGAAARATRDESGNRRAARNESAHGATSRGERLRQTRRPLTSSGQGTTGVADVSLVSRRLAFRAATRNNGAAESVEVATLFAFAVFHSFFIVRARPRLVSVPSAARSRC